MYLHSQIYFFECTKLNGHTVYFYNLTKCSLDLQPTHVFYSFNVQATMANSSLLDVKPDIIQHLFKIVSLHFKNTIF